MVLVKKDEENEKDEPKAAASDETAVKPVARETAEPALTRISEPARELDPPDEPEANGRAKTTTSARSVSSTQR
jgi:hypothetical protein